MVHPLQNESVRVIIAYRNALEIRSKLMERPEIHPFPFCFLATFPMIYLLLKLFIEDDELNSTNVRVYINFSN